MGKNAKERIERILKGYENPVSEKTRYRVCLVCGKERILVTDCRQHIKDCWGIELGPDEYLPKVPPPEAFEYHRKHNALLVVSLPAGNHLMSCANFMNTDAIDKTVEEWEAKWGNPENPPRPKGIVPCAECVDKPNLRPFRCCFKLIPGTPQPKTDTFAVQADLMRLVDEGRRASHGPDSQPGEAAGRAFWGPGI